MRCLIIILIILIVVRLLSSREGLTNKPNEKERQQMVESVLQNKNLFGNTSDMLTTRNVLPWMDAISYEDLRKLYRHEKFTKSNINNIFD